MSVTITLKKRVFSVKHAEGEAIEVSYNEDSKRMTITPKNGKQDFRFIESDPHRVANLGEMLTETADFLLHPQNAGAY